MSRTAPQEQPRAESISHQQDSGFSAGGPDLHQAQTSTHRVDESSASLHRSGPTASEKLAPRRPCPATPCLQELKFSVVQKGQTSGPAGMLVSGTGFWVQTLHMSGIICSTVAGTAMLANAVWHTGHGVSHQHALRGRDGQADLAQAGSCAASKQLLQSPALLQCRAGSLGVCKCCMHGRRRPRSKLLSSV